MPPTCRVANRQDDRYPDPERPYLSVRDGRMPASEVLPVSLVIGDSTPPREARMGRRSTPETVAAGPGAGS